MIPTYIYAAIRDKYPQCFPELTLVGYVSSKRAVYEYRSGPGLKIGSSFDVLDTFDLYENPNTGSGVNKDKQFIDPSYARKLRLDFTKYTDPKGCTKPGTHFYTTLWAIADEYVSTLDNGYTIHMPEHVKNSDSFKDIVIHKEGAIDTPIHIQPYEIPETGTVIRY